MVYEHTSKPLTLRRVPPNLLCSQGATEFAAELGMPILPHDALISPAARERWVRWRADLKVAERKAKKTRAHPSSYMIRNGIEPTEELAQMRIRQQHTQNLLRGYPSLLQSPSPEPSDGSRHSSIMNSSTTLSDPLEPPTEQPPDRSTDDLLVTSERPAVYPLGEVLASTVTESSQNAFINSTQKVPTVSQFRSHKTVRGAASGKNHEDSEMKDLSNAPIPSVFRHKTWGDGSDDELATNLGGPIPGPSFHAPPALAVDSISPETPAEKDIQPPSHHTTTPSCQAEETVPLSSRSSGAPSPQPDRPDHITDTVGAIAVDSWGRIACGASSGGIGMKYRGRVGPAALVGVGAAVVPVDPEDTEQTSVATVTSGTGEHMATTMAATVCAERLYQSVKKTTGGEYASVTEDEALRAMIENEFMGNQLHWLSARPADVQQVIPVLSIATPPVPLAYWVSKRCAQEYCFTTATTQTRLPWRPCPQTRTYPSAPCPAVRVTGRSPKVVACCPQGLARRRKWLLGRLSLDDNPNIPAQSCG
jgi:taspase (threonine aspartase 1)